MLEDEGSSGGVVGLAKISWASPLVGRDEGRGSERPGRNTRSVASETAAVGWFRASLTSEVPDDADASSSVSGDKMELRGRFALCTVGSAGFGT